MATPAGIDPKTYDYIVTNYGYLAAFLQIPEVGSIIATAAKGGWDEARLEGALSKTKWWNTTSATAREFSAQQKLDPASWRQTMDNTVNDIQQQAMKLGMGHGQPGGLSLGDLWQMAYNYNAYGWTSSMLSNVLSAHFQYKTGAKYSGTAAETISTLKQAASDYLVPLSDQTVGKWTKDIMSGNVDAAAFDSYLREQAKSLFPGLSAAIDSGVTVKQYVEPYRQIATQLLEVDPASINFYQPKWQSAISQVDPKSGQRTSMSLADWQRHIMTDPSYNYANTNNGRAAAADMGSSLLAQFGFTGGGSSMSEGLSSLRTDYSTATAGA